MACPSCVCSCGSVLNLLNAQTSEKQMRAKEQGESAAQGASEDVIYKIEVPANRYPEPSCLPMVGSTHVPHRIRQIRHSVR